MIKAGDIVKLKNPGNKREAKRRWRMLDSIAKPLGSEGAFTLNLRLRRLDTIKRDIEEHPENLFASISFWEKICRRY